MKKIKVSTIITLLEKNWKKLWMFGHLVSDTCSKPWAYLLILTQSGGTMEDSEFFTSIRYWRGVRRDGWKNVSLLIKHTCRHQIIAVTESSTQIGPSISSHLSLTVTHTHTQVAPPVQRRQCSLVRGPSASGGLLCGGRECQWQQRGSAPSSPAAPGRRTGLRRAPSYSRTCTNKQKHDGNATTAGDKSQNTIRQPL